MNLTVEATAATKTIESIIPVEKSFIIKEYTTHMTVFAAMLIFVSSIP